MKLVKPKLKDRDIECFNGHCHVFGNFSKSYKVSSDQLNSKTNDMVLLLKTI